MREGDVRERAFAMPLTNPAYPPGRYRFVNREFLVITYGTDPEKLARWCRSRSGLRAASSNTSSCAWRIRPAPATTPRPVRSSRSCSAAARGTTYKARQSFSELPGDRLGASANASKTKPAKLRDVSDEKTNAHGPRAKTGLQSMRPGPSEMGVGDEHGPIALRDNR
jgi:hypothetical protein